MCTPRKTEGVDPREKKKKQKNKPPPKKKEKQARPSLFEKTKLKFNH